MAMTPDELEAAAAVAQRACDQARMEILPRFRNVGVEWKEDGSPVTEADRAAERTIRSILKEAYPDFGLVGEEYGSEHGSSDDAPSWIIDPIDGTISFSRGIPLFGTLIALMDEGAPVVGVIDLPVLDERFVGWLDGGCRRNGEPIKSSTVNDIKRCLISTGDPICFGFAGHEAVYERMTREIPFLRGYTDCFGHAMVLSGGLDAMVDCDLNPWDAAATQLLAIEAGGACVTRRRSAGKVDLIFGSPALVEQLEGFFES
jgi:histidinol phosphatase-like enzyme (inositol monophosphatase family)